MTSGIEAPAFYSRLKRPCRRSEQNHLMSFGAGDGASVLHRLYLVVTGAAQWRRMETGTGEKDFLT
jgi:hypothetical protein